MTAATHFRGHMFADLRGYTAFIERAGNAAGAELVSRFRQLVRDEVGDHEGAEVKVEGDAIYIVFPSASTAVMCGLALIEKAAEATAENPDLPIRVGIGVHAGEAVEVAEGGYIGTAVNLAARVAAVAGPGELLVSGTVRGILQSSIPVTFAPRGRKRLKGINEPVELYLVVPEGATAPARPVNRLMLAGAATVIAAVALGAIAFAAWPRDGGSPKASGQPTPGNRILNPEPGPLSIGQYASTTFAWPFQFTVTESGWALFRESSDGVGLAYERDPRGSLDVTRIDEVYTDPCIPRGAAIATGTTPEDLHAAFSDVPFLLVDEAEPQVVGTRTVLVFDAIVDEGAQAACSTLGGEVALFRIGQDDWSALPGERIRVHAFAVGGATVAAVAAADGWPDLPVPAMEAFFGVAERLIRTLEF